MANYSLVLGSQKNEVFQLITQTGLDPKDFVWVQSYSDFTADLIVSSLGHKPSKFYFKFDFSNGKHLCKFSPGAAKNEDIAYPDSWGEELKYFVRWLEYLKRELSQSDLWEQISELQQTSDIDTRQDISNEPFAPSQVTQIIESLEKVRAFLYENKLVADGRSQFVNEKIDYLIEAVNRQGRKDWIYTCIGALVTIAVALALAPDKAKAMFDIIKASIAGLLRLLQ